MNTFDVKINEFNSSMHALLLHFTVCCQRSDTPLKHRNRETNVKQRELDGGCRGSETCCWRTHTLVTKPEAKVSYFVHVQLNYFLLNNSDGTEIIHSSFIINWGKTRGRRVECQAGGVNDSLGLLM